MFDTVVHIAGLALAACLLLAIVLIGLFWLAGALGWALALIGGVLGYLIVTPIRVVAWAVYNNRDRRRKGRR